MEQNISGSPPLPAHALPAPQSALEVHDPPGVVVEEPLQVRELPQKQLAGSMQLHQLGGMASAQKLAQAVSSRQPAMQVPLNSSQYSPGPHWSSREHSLPSEGIQAGGL